MSRFKERPPGVEEWDGYTYSREGYASEDEYYEAERKAIENLKYFASERKRLGIPDPKRTWSIDDGFSELFSDIPSRICSCCGKPLCIKAYCHEVCRNCGWKDDKKQAADPELRGESNEMSLNEAKRAFKNGEKVK